MNSRLRWSTLKAILTWHEVAIVAFLLLLARASQLHAQSPANSTSEAESIRQQARSAVLGTAQPTSIDFNGTFVTTMGPHQQDGSAHLTVNYDGSFLVDLPGNAGPISESRSVNDGAPSCNWTDRNGESHRSAFLNCLSPAWFFPALTLLSNSSDPSEPSWSPSSITSDSLGDHLFFQFGLSSTDPSFGVPHPPRPFELVLAPETHLPLFALFNVHPESGRFNADIPVKIAYSNYESISGVMVPLHIQRYLNGALITDITITSASVR